jgi:amino acid transporter
MRDRPLELVRGLGIWPSAAIVAGTMIGTGIFLVPSEMARSAKSLGGVFAAWIVGGALSLFGAISYAELGAAIPEAGGDYVYLNRGFSPAVGFLFGWMHTFVGRPASIATIAAGILRFGSFLLPAVALPMFSLHVPLPFQDKPLEFIFTAAQPLAVVVIALVTLVNYLGVREGGRVQVGLTLLKVAAVVAVVIPGFLAPGAGLQNYAPLWRWEAGTLGGFFAALIAALWAFDGWADLALVGSEVSEPHRNVPRALIGGVIFVGVAYLLANAAYFYALTFDAVARSAHVASDVVERFAGRGAAQWVTLAMGVSALGTLNSSILSGARVPYAMARDRRFFRFAASVHPRFRTPSGALIFQAALASALALTGTYEDLYSLFIFATFIFYGLVTAALFRLRRTEPEMARPYRTWGYPWAPALFLLGAFVVTVNVWIERPLRSSIGLGLILLGLPFYRTVRAKVANGRPEKV